MDNFVDFGKAVLWFWHPYLFKFWRLWTFETLAVCFRVILEGHVSSPVTISSKS